MVTTKQFLKKLDKRISDKNISKNKTLQRLAGKKMNLKWCLKTLTHEIALIERMQRKVMRKRF